MKTITTLLSAAVLVAGETVAGAQGGADSRGPVSPPGATQGAGTGTNPGMSNPSNAPGAAISGQADPNSTRSMDERAGGVGQANERNPDGSTGGTKANPSPR